MELQALNYKEYSKLLQRINDMTFEERQVAKFERQLTKFFEAYHIMLIEIAIAIEKYREIAAKINASQPLVKRKEPQEID